jgi:hypothetical protein
MNNMAFIKLHIRKEEGATSIFVITLMVVLIVFGLAALTTSLASLKLSNKNTLWIKEYYALEGEAERLLSIIDGTLIGVADEAKSASNENKDQYVDIYYEKVWSNLFKLSEAFPEIHILKEKNQVTYTVKEKKDAYPKNITVVLDILEPSTNNTETNHQRFAILQWKEWQNQFEYDQDIDFENPNFENPNFKENLTDEVKTNNTDTITDETNQEGIFVEEEIELID